MRAVRLSPQGLDLKVDFPPPQPTENEVLVRVLKAGICETDLQLIHGYMGFRGTLGHEFVGVAESGRYAGQRVVGAINCACGVCETCQQNRPHHCPHRSVLGILDRDGAFADKLVLPERNLYPVDDSIPTEHAVFVEPLAAALRILEQVPIDSRHRVLILGDGRLGNLCAQAIATTGANLAVVGKHPEKLALLINEGITTHLLDNLDLSKRADIVVDCTGSENGFSTALKLVRPEGTIVLKTTVAGEQTTQLWPVVVDEVKVIGSRCGNFVPALEALRQHRVNVAPMISAIRPLEDYHAAFDDARRKNMIKVLFHISD
ncbi:MDR/zinc-dependent alcohol dehydrogenase-like family protein [Thalassoroseus pseudoceratinae]|uniref:MDR/zinc-dependent alcohol dehydrogenase-like family protein n=1 Tax=Thalassoroseus pseudoceratinae TaxID=2713176 RepID=UPI00141D7BF1|nr:alcohol dehydrogenase catalytic domain-containing protein [Thalassoroseus pseudoceratinae]